MSAVDLARSLQSQNIWFARQQYVDAEIKLARHNLGLGDATPKVERKEAPKAEQKQVEKPANKAVEMVRELKEELSSNNNDSQISAMMDRVLKLEKENEAIRGSLEKALARLEILEKQPAAASAAAPAAAAPAKKPENEDDESDDDDDDFFATSDEDDEEAAAAAEALKAKRVAEYNARKAAKEEKKGKVIAKSSIVFDVKPWDDETDLDALCAKIKQIEKPGLLWGGAQKKPLAYGIFKLCVSCVVEDDKCGSDELVEEIEGFEDEVQSVDIAAFNKI